MRRRRTGRFEQNAAFDGEDINPMDGVANLADVMLVFACGLMLALITYWNVDVSGVTGGVNADVGQEIVQQQTGSESDNTEDSGEYEKYGTVYRDPQTGKLYMVEDGDAE